MLVIMLLPLLSILYYTLVQATIAYNPLGADAAADADCCLDAGCEALCLTSTDDINDSVENPINTSIEGKYEEMPLISQRSTRDDFLPDGSLLLSLVKPLSASESHTESLLPMSDKESPSRVTLHGTSPPVKRLVSMKSSATVIDLLQRSNSKLMFTRRPLRVKPRGEAFDLSLVI